jgi:isopentenyldiphosphate isomerase
MFLGASAVGEELFELVDEDGRVIGTAPRSKCHGDPSLAHRSVHVFVHNRRGDLYLQKRSPTKDVQPGKWDTSRIRRFTTGCGPGTSWAMAGSRCVRAAGA